MAAKHKTCEQCGRDLYRKKVGAGQGKKVLCLSCTHAGYYFSLDGEVKHIAAKFATPAPRQDAPPGLLATIGDFPEDAPRPDASEQPATPPDFGDMNINGVNVPGERVYDVIRDIAERNSLGHVLSELEEQNDRLAAELQEARAANTEVMRHLQSAVMTAKYLPTTAGMNHIQSQLEQAIDILLAARATGQMKGE